MSQKNIFLLNLQTFGTQMNKETYYILEKNWRARIYYSTLKKIKTMTN